MTGVGRGEPPAQVATLEEKLVGCRINAPALGCSVDQGNAESRHDFRRDFVLDSEDIIQCPVETR